MKGMMRKGRGHDEENDFPFGGEEGRETDGDR